MGKVIKNYGLDIKKEEADQSDQDLVFGAIKERGLAEGIEFEKYLPEGEVQKGAEDFMDCASRGPHNIIETKLWYLYSNDLLSKGNKTWLNDNGYTVSDDQGFVTGIEISDRFTAIKSGTTKNGNSLKAPVHSVYKNGVIPKSILPANISMTWKQYNDPSKITRDMEETGLEFLKRFPIGYEKLSINDFAKALKTDMLDIALHAWPRPINGIYPRTNAGLNHVVASFNTKLYKIFDNYIDSVDGDFMKVLASDYKLYNTAYRIIIKEVKPLKVGFKFEVSQGLASQIQAFLKSLGIKNMKIVEDYPILGSSADPEKLALTVKGILTGVIPMIILVSGMFGATLDTAEINGIIELISSSVVAVGLAVSTVMTTLGALRKVVTKFKK